MDSGKKLLMSWRVRGFESSRVGGLESLRVGGFESWRVRESESLGVNKKKHSVKILAVKDSHGMIIK